MMFFYLLSVVVLIFATSEGTPLGADPCTVTEISQVESAAASCDTLTIGDLEVPAATTLKIILRDGANLVFTGHVTNKAADYDNDVIQIRGRNVDISGTDSHLLDGMGPDHWKGANEPTILRPKFIRFNLTSSTIRNLKLKNCPNNCFMLSDSDGVHIKNIEIDNKEGYPGVAGDHYAKNTDGFDIVSGSNIWIEDSTVWNQDDCVAVNGGHNMVFERLHCNGSHGLSFSVSEGDVYNVTFKNSVVKNSGNVIHVKTHNDKTTTGTIRDILYQNITFSGIDHYVVSIQQNYPRGEAKGNVPISGLTLDGLRGSMKGKRAMAYQIVCAENACSDFNFKNMEITGAKKANECQNVPAGIQC